MPNFDEHRIAPGQKVDLRKLESDGKDLVSNPSQLENEFHERRTEIVELGEKLFAEGRQKLLIVFQAMDGGGKDGTIRSVFEGANPQWVEVTSFRKPSAEELSRPQSQFRRQGRPAGRIWA